MARTRKVVDEVGLSADVPVTFSGFRSQYDRVFSKSRREGIERFPAAVGSGIVQLYTPKVNESGILELVPDGEHNLYAEIQSHARSTDLDMIVERYFSGDPTALNRVQGTYMDVSEVPTSFHEAIDLVQRAEREFVQLPPDIRDRFGNDWQQWLAAMGSEDWIAKMQVAQPDAAAAAQSVGDIVQGGADGGEA